MASRIAERQSQFGGGADVVAGESAIGRRSSTLCNTIEAKARGKVLLHSPRLEAKVILHSPSLEAKTLRHSPRLEAKVLLHLPRLFFVCCVLYLDQ